MAALDMPFQEAIRRATAVQQRLGLTLSQMRDACKHIAAAAAAAGQGAAGGAQLSSEVAVPGTEKKPVLVAGQGLAGRGGPAVSDCCLTYRCVPVIAVPSANHCPATSSPACLAAAC